MSGPIYQNHIDGRPRAGEEGRNFQAVNPTTGHPWGTFAESSAADIDAAVRAAARALDGPWGRLSPTRRGRLMMAWGDRIAANAENIARIESTQNGKLVGEMLAQARVVCDWLYYFGGLADKIEGRTIPLERRSVLNYTLREPLGVVGVIVPWNSPTFLTLMSCAPALAAGNTIVLKPSEVTSASAFELVRLAEEAGFPPGVVNVVTGARAAGEALVDHPMVAKICFTGSDGAGRAIAARAGARLASCTLELGGKSPNIVFADTDINEAVEGAHFGLFFNHGQCCCAGSRVFVEQKIYDQFVEKSAARANKRRVGDPFDPATEQGPQVDQTQFDRVMGYIDSGRVEGAKLVCGGGRVGERGYFIQPTVFADVQDEMTIAREEIFGPVMSIIPFKGIEEVIDRANRTTFGLAAAVWTKDVQKAHAVAHSVRAGTVWVNCYNVLDNRAPFGGFKQSGIGRELGEYGLQQYTEVKTVTMKL
jgi:acyl-CoA reductase-like NAD-dependent aldehyde dehydrogenase